MKYNLLKQIIKKKEKKIEFSIVTNLKSGESCIFEENKNVNKNFEKYIKKIKFSFKQKNDGIIKGTDLFIENYVQPINVVIIGAVHIAQSLINFLKIFNFKISIIDPRSYFISKKRFPNIKTINKWPNEALKNFQRNQNTALIALTHDPKIDDPAICYALNNNFFYIGALGSKDTHKNRCIRLKKSGLTDAQIKKIFGPIGIKIGGKSAPEIALSITTQLVSEINKKKN
jgi:xanthine dehydrogenase accessory factor